MTKKYFLVMILTKLISRSLNDQFYNNSSVAGVSRQRCSAPLIGNLKSINRSRKKLKESSMYTLSKRKLLEKTK